MSSEAMTVSDMRERVIEKAMAEGKFRAELLADPKKALESELGVVIPDGFQIHVHEDDANGCNLVLPPSAELDESDLELAAGGNSDPFPWWD